VLHVVLEVLLHRAAHHGGNHDHAERAQKLVVNISERGESISWLPKTERPA
jgi:hypothetical protein